MHAPLRRIFETQESLSEEDTRRGLRMLMVNGVCSMGAGAVQGGIFLSAFALAIGATNYEIGLLATIGFFSQLMQLPGLYLVQQFGRRRGITVIFAGLSRLVWISIVLIPFLFVGTGVSFLIVWLALASLLMAACVPAWNSLIRTIVPTDLFGRFFSRIGVSLFMVTVLAMTSQLTNILFLQIWGRLGDRFSNKAVLSVSGPLFLLAILAWGFTTMPEQYFLTIPLLFAIHILSGISTAGVTLGATNISLKLSPHGTAHAYMTVFGLAGALTGAVAPLVGGVIADFFALRELSLSINWSEPARQVSVYALNFRALDFLFGIAFLVGFYSLNRLARVKEEGEVSEGGIVEGLVGEMVTPFRSFSTAAGIRRLAAMPVDTLRRGLKRKESGGGESDAEKD